jgi:uncharacterized repeat protein (TIGR03803 family)
MMAPSANCFPNHQIMKRPSVFFAAVTLAIFCMPVRPAAGQVFSNLYSFSTVVSSSNSDGALPYAAFVQSGATLYGTTFKGGVSNGTIFAINTDGSGFTNLHSFTSTTGARRTNYDGSQPLCGMVLSGNTLYGAAAIGGTNGFGSIYALNTSGGGFTNIHYFANASAEGIEPEGQLALAGNTLYGTAQGGGSNAFGTVFRLNTDGTAFTNLHNFAIEGSTVHSNGEGGQPIAGVIVYGNILFGTGWSGGTGAQGAVFRLNNDGTAFTNLHSFGSLTNNTNGDGAQPFGGLVLGGNTLYGTAHIGGAFSNGTIFRVNIDGTGFTNLHSFTAVIGGTNTDGAQPFGSLILSGNTLYGTAVAGGSFTNGTIFKLKTDGTGYTVLYNFSGFIAGTNNSDGGGPVSAILSGNTLYGLAHWGGVFGSGAVFSLVLPPSPQLGISISGTNVILSWPTNAPGFALQSTTNLPSPGVWNTNYPGPAVIGNQYILTNPISGPQMFYRLSQ